ncbi:MAG: RNA pseudouridine synthase [Bdellovibrio sp.]|nr:RNA pseudouridine synthase [Bdellovibrio sp.]
MIKIAFQNKDFVVCDKPAQVLSVPGREKLDVRPCLGLLLQKELKTQIYPVHRLDFEVSGLIMYALSSQAHKVSQRWFEKKEIQKKYVAVTSLQKFLHWPEGIPTDRRVISTDFDQVFNWKTRILRGKKRSFESDQGDWAETKAILKKADKNQIQWQLYPITGRSHQLRLELSRHGFPIHGDELYGSSVKYAKPGIALRAYQIDMLHISDRLGLPQTIEVEKDLV